MGSNIKKYLPAMDFPKAVNIKITWNVVEGLYKLNLKYIRIILQIKPKNDC